MRSTFYKTNSKEEPKLEKILDNDCADEMGGFKTDENDKNTFKDRINQNLRNYYVENFDESKIDEDIDESDDELGELKELLEEKLADLDDYKSK